MVLGCSVTFSLGLGRQSFLDGPFWELFSSQEGSWGEGRAGELILKLPLTCPSLGCVSRVMKQISGTAAVASLLVQSKPFPNQIYGP